MRIFVMIGLCSLLFGCVNDQIGPLLASWQGSHFSEVTATWGPPEECTADDQQRICQWQIRPTALVAEQLSAGSKSCTMMLAFDAEGTVTGWRWRGNSCQQTATAAAANTARERPDALLLGDDESASGVATTGR